MHYPAVCGKWVTQRKAMRIGLTEPRTEYRPECWINVRAWGMPLPNIGSMDGNTGRS
jgi:hypothetical protein